MRNIKLAPSFDREFFGISAYVEDRFGIAAADALEARFRQVAANLAELPLSGTQDHGYDTDLFGFILYPNWIFYRFTDEQIVFLHIRDGRREKGEQVFE